MDTKHILVMESDQDARAYLTDLLRYFGYIVDLAHSGDTAIRRLRQKSYDVLLLDRIQASQNDPSLLHWLHENDREEPLILMDGHEPESPLLPEALANGFESINKPIQPAQLKRLLDQILTPDWQPHLSSEPVARD